MHGTDLDGRRIIVEQANGRGRSRVPGEGRCFSESSFRSFQKKNSREGGKRLQRTRTLGERLPERKDWVGRGRRVWRFQEVSFEVSVAFSAQQVAPSPSLWVEVSVEEQEQE